MKRYFKGVCRDFVRILIDRKEDNLYNEENKEMALVSFWIGGCDSWDYSRNGAVQEEDMGIYLNPGNDGFTESIHTEIYVDKTGLIAHTNKCLNTKLKFICVSRPRRFGKSMALEMLAAYYSLGCDSMELFHGLKIESDPTFKKYLNKYDVIFLNMQQFLSRAKNQEMTQYLECAVIREIRKVYGGIFPEQETMLAAVLEHVYLETGRKFIFLIDEWDCVMREKQDSEKLQEHYLDFLRNLLKDQPYVALVYMTGILPVKKYGTHSALNMFWEYSMTDQKALEEYTGFTEEEVKELCERFGLNFAQTSISYEQGNHGRI